MKTELKDLRVAYMPTEVGNDINQESSVEEILACENTELYTLSDFFQKQNDENFGLYFFFLIDVKNSRNLTGRDIDYVDNNIRTEKIKRIKDILSTWGNTSAMELGLEKNPCLETVGNEKDNFSELIKEFYPNHVSTVTYHDDVEIAFNDYDYEDLSDDIIDEIAEIIDNYENNCLM